jgi:hypothetical protein
MTEQMYVKIQRTWIAPCAGATALAPKIVALHAVLLHPVPIERSPSILVDRASSADPPFISQPWPEIRHKYTALCGEAH